MSREISSLFSFNRGIISPLGLARTDVKRSSLAAETQNNYMPRVLGSMTIRPGLGYIGSTQGNAASKFIPFVKSTTDTALLEITSAGIMRVWINDELVSIDPVGSQTTNGTFTGSIAGWTINDEAGATSSWNAGGYLQQVSNGTAHAVVDQTVTVAAGDINKEHSLYIVVQRGPVILRVGTVPNTDSYIKETLLETGNHWLSFTPTGDFNIEFRSALIPAVLVQECIVINTGSAQQIAVPVPWASVDLSNLRWDQSADVIFVACAGLQQRRIERRAAHSWSVVLYKTPDGPFLPMNTGAKTISTSAISGDVVLTASDALFTVPTGPLDNQRGHVGALFSLDSIGQLVTVSISAQNTFTDPIRVTGIGGNRQFLITVDGVTVHGGTVTLQRSVGSPGVWGLVAQYAVDATNDIANDGLDNQIIYYRIGIKTGDFVAGPVVCTLSYPSGSITGIIRLTAVNSTTVAQGQVLTPLGGITATTAWSEGKWSAVQGYPTAVAFYEGRLWWAGLNGIIGSISDAFNSFDDTFIGDAGPINRTIGSGPVDTINWILPLQRLILGAQGSEISARSSALDDVLSPTNFNLKTASTQGSAAIPAAKIDQRGVFISRTGARAYQLEFNFQFYDYQTTDITALVPEILKAGVVRMAVQRQPDTRIHFVMSDGSVVIAVQDHLEEVLAFITFETQGTVEDVVVLPNLTNSLEDQVYYVVNRTINGSTVRYLEKWAQELECRGDQQLCKLADSFITYTGAATQVISVPHLEGEEVVVWADGADVGTIDTTTPWTQRYTVTGSQIVLASAASNVVIGLPYSAQFKSSKLGMATQQIQTTLNQQKKIGHLGLILAYAHPKGLKFGADFTVMDDMPLLENSNSVGTAIETSYDENMIEFPGLWTTDLRLCLQSQAPRPITIMAATVDSRMNN